MGRLLIPMLVLVAAAFAAGAWFYPQMPAFMASHWNYMGQVDGFLPRFWGVFLMPLVSLLVLGAFLFIPKIDPLRKNIMKFWDYYESFMFIVVAFLVYIYGLSLAWNLGLRFSMGLLVVPAIGALVYYAGILLENAKRNWFIGIRTPWTMSSDRVWEKTHKLGSKLFKASGILAVLAVLLPEPLTMIALAPVLIASMYLVLYSYLEFKKEKK